ncbi:hypothetical protein Amet_2376 [Alkaliphilus metalliredigens QYMF]|uniref:Uncharacterized protein n=1 Tax=Alkaliphilus metalliredigens (strain QYMF) TaxID=293826 RepID=A6TQR2_ALKMQ|nr:hypothetical protein [Alkaliphilus metalliredigens]ABR48530.1 hypothetical protein Amet_2376 [Alkaliphilus metalliredigens QYMF]
MPFLREYEFIVKNKSGTVYNFYLNENHHIEYIYTDANGKWLQKNQVFQKKTLQFSVTLDSSNQIHIISYTSTGDLYYHTLKGGRWNHRLLMNYPKGTYQIFYPVIKSINDAIHIFYYLVHGKNKGNVFLLHLVNNQDEWNRNEVLHCTYNQVINPYKILNNQSKIYALTTSLQNNYEEVSLTSYDLADKTWDKDSIQLTSDPIQKLYTDGILTSPDHLHITWSQYDQERLTVHHLNYHLTEDRPLSSTKQISTGLNASYPTLMGYDGKLWCLWVEINQLFSSHSSTDGLEWSSPIGIDESRHLDFRRYRFITNDIEETKKVMCDFLFGTLYPKIQFIGFGGEVNDEVQRDQ